MKLNSKYKALDSGVLVPEDHKRYPIGLDLFCGCGGFSLGFIQAGYEVIAGFEISPDAAHTYMCNLGSHPIKIHYTSEKYKEILTDYFEKWFKKIEKRQKKPGLIRDHEDMPMTSLVSGDGWMKMERLKGNHYPPVTNFFFGDITEVDGAWILEKLGLKRGDIDVVMGGPPCQGYSRAGHKNVMDPRNSLIFDFARIVTELYPKTFVMEEVPDVLNFVTPEGLPVVDELVRIFESGGYGDYEMLKKGMFNSKKKAKAARKKKSQKTPEASGQLEMEFE